MWGLVPKMWGLGFKAAVALVEGYGGIGSPGVAQIWHALRCGMGGKTVAQGGRMLP